MVDGRRLILGVLDGRGLVLTVVDVGRLALASDVGSDVVGSDTADQVVNEPVYLRSSPPLHQAVEDAGYLLLDGRFSRRCCRRS